MTFVTHNLGLLTQRPEHVDALKQHILALAVRGLLVPQDPADEPAAKLLKRIKAEKVRMAKEGNSKKVKALSPIKVEELLFELPKGWGWCRLGEIISISSGNALTSSEMNREGDIPVYGGNGITGWHDKFMINHPTIVIGRVGFYCGSIHLSNGKAWVTDNAFITTYNETEINREFLVLLLKGTNLKENENATAQPVISGRKIYPIVVGVPPLPEQRRIVEKVESLFARIDRLSDLARQGAETRQRWRRSLLHYLGEAPDAAAMQQRWAQLSAHFDTLIDDKAAVQELRQAILQLAVRGALLPQDPADEPATELLKRIKAEKARAGRKNENLAPVRAEEAPFPLPTEWIWLRLGDIGQTQTGTTPPKNNPAFFGTYIPFLGPGDFVNEKINYENIGLSNEGLKKGRLICNGSILMVCIGGSIGKTVMVNRDVSCNQQINSITPFAVDNKFILIVLKSESFQKLLREKSTGSATPIVNKSKWENIPIPLPPLPEQHRIVEKVGQLMQWCDRLEAALEQRDGVLGRMVSAVPGRLG